MVDEAFSAVGAVLLLYAAFTRVIPPLFRYPLPPISELYDLYIGFNPFVSHFCIYLASLPLQLALSLFSSSALTVTDRLFPFGPTVISFMYAVHAPLSSDRRTGGLPDARLSLLAFILLLWASQVLRSSVAAGYYSWGVEDGRYERLRARLGRIGFALLSLTGVCASTTAQFLITSPLSFVWTGRAAPQAGSLDAVDAALASVLFLTVLCKELCSAQSAAFFEAHPERKFVDTGIHGWVRQPVVLAEVCFWWAFYLFAVGQAKSFAIWPLLGPLWYSFIVCGWTLHSERAMAEDKEYAKFQSNVWCFLPTPPSAPTPTTAEKKSN